MRNFGLMLMLAGVVGFFYCNSEMERFSPLPPGMSVTESLETDRGKWDAARYAAAAGAVARLLLAMLPQGRG